MMNNRQTKAYSELINREDKYVPRLGGVRYYRFTVTTPI